MNWKELKNGWGLEQIPRDIAKNLQCCMCGSTRVLYTNENIELSANAHLSTERYRVECAKRLERLRNYTFCKTHAIAYYKD